MDVDDDRYVCKYCAAIILRAFSTEAQHIALSAFSIGNETHASVGSESAVERTVGRKRVSKELVTSMCRTEVMHIVCFDRQRFVWSWPLLKH